MSMKAYQDGWNLVGSCAVDSGQLIVTDPCYLKSHWEANEFTSTTDEDKNDFSYDGACVTTLRHTAGQLENGFGTRYLGVATSTTGGDGVFPVYIRFEFNNPMEMRIMLDGTKLSRNGELIGYNDCEICGTSLHDDNCDYCHPEDR